MKDLGEMVTGGGRPELFKVVTVVRLGEIPAAKCDVISLANNILPH
jgi:hypothetical protein